MTQATTTQLGQIKMTGSLSGTGNNPQLAQTGVSAGSYTIPVLTINSEGRITQATLTNLITDLIPLATYNSKGLVQIGDSLTINSGALSTNVASETELGVVKTGLNIINNDGIISVDYSIPIASETVLGGVKLGNNISINSGIISIPNASNSVKGVVSVAENGVLSINNGVLDADIPTASTTTKGLIQIGNTLTVNNGIVDFDGGTNYVQKNANNIINSYISYNRTLYIELSSYALDMNKSAWVISLGTQSNQSITLTPNNFPVNSSAPAMLRIYQNSEGGKTITLSSHFKIASGVSINMPATPYAMYIIEGFIWRDAVDTFFFVTRTSTIIP